MTSQPQDGPCPVTGPFMVRREGVNGDELFQAVTAHPAHAGESFEEMRLGQYGVEGVSNVKSVVADGHAPARLPFTKDSTFPLPSFRDSDAKRTRLGTQVVYFHVGSEETEDFSIHESIIAPRSEFVRLAIRGQWKEAKDRIIPLPTDEPTTFAIYQEYLYTGIIFTRDLEAQESHPSEFELLVKLYILGEKLMDSQLKDVVIDCIIEKLRIEQRFDIRLTDLVYEGTPSEFSPLRVLFMDIYYHSGTPDWLDESTVDIHEGFLADFSKFQMQQRNSFATAEAKYMGNPCAYHEHGDQPCYRQRCPAYITPQTEFGKILNSYVAPVVPKPSQTPSGFPLQVLSGVGPPLTSGPAAGPFQQQPAGGSLFQRCYRCNQSISALFPTCRCHPHLPPQLQPDTSNLFTHQGPTLGSQASSLFGPSTAGNDSIQSQLRLISDQLSRLQTSITGPPPYGLTPWTGVLGNPATRIGDVTHTGAGFQTTQGPGLFGQASQTTTGGSLFGAPSTSATGGGLFGGGTSAPSSSGGLFGSHSSAPTPGGLFGTQPSTETGTSLFGARAIAQTSPELVGSNADVRQGGSSLFGSGHSDTQSGRSLFGGDNSGTQSGRSLFGNPTAQTGGSSVSENGAVRPPGTGLFGSRLPSSIGDDASPNDRPATSGLFRAPSTGGGSGSLFGNSAAQDRHSLFNSNRVAGANSPGTISLFGGRQAGTPPSNVAGASGDSGSRPSQESPSVHAAAAQGASDPGQRRAAPGDRGDGTQ